MMPCRATVRTPRSATISDTSISSRPSLTEPPSSPKPPSGGGLKGQALWGFGQGGQSETDATISIIVTFNAGSSDCRAQAGSDCRATHALYCEVGGQAQAIMATLWPEAKPGEYRRLFSSIDRSL